MAVVNGKKSEGNGRLPLFSYSNVPWCILLSVKYSDSIPGLCLQSTRYSSSSYIWIFIKTFKRKVPAESIEDQEITQSSCDPHYKNDNSNRIMGMIWDIHCGKGTRNILHCHLLGSKQEVIGILPNFSEYAGMYFSRRENGQERKMTTSKKKRQNKLIAFKFHLLLIILGG